MNPMQSPNTGVGRKLCPTPESEGLGSPSCCAFSILNHLGHEVGTVETDSDPIVAYAIKVNAPSSRLREAGYKAIPSHNITR